MKLIGALLLALSAFVLTEADPTECYACNIFDLNDCKGPLDTSKVTTKSCSDIDTWGRKNTTAKKVCYHTEYEFLGLTLNARGCHYAEMENHGICDFMKDNEGKLFTDFKCKVCDTTNCNTD